MRNINKVVLHCSATKEGVEISKETITKWHRERGFRTIGYHYLIHLDGTVEEGRKEIEVGAHVTGQNSYSIGICYIGGLDEKGKPKDTRTEKQKESLFELVKDILDRYKLKLEDVYGHYQFANKACPCFKMEEFYKEYIEYIQKKYFY